jgi:hypothetical protein
MVYGNMHLRKCTLCCCWVECSVSVESVDLLWFHSSFLVTSSLVLQVLPYCAFCMLCSLYWQILLYYSFEEINSAQLGRHFKHVIIGLDQALWQLLSENVSEWNLVLTCHRAWLYCRQFFFFSSYSVSCFPHHEHTVIKAGKQCYLDNC